MYIHVCDIYALFYSPWQCAEKFVEFVKRANIAELTSMEVILTKAIKDKQIDPEVFDVLWYFVKDSRHVEEQKKNLAQVL